MTFRDQLKKLNACDASLEWVKDKTIEEAWETCENSEWMIWVLTQTCFDLIDPICDIAEGILHLIPEDNRLVCSNAISAARRRASKEELNAARTASYHNSYYVFYDSFDVSITYHVYSAARYAARYAADFASCTNNTDDDASANAASCAYLADNVCRSASSAFFYYSGYYFSACNKEQKKQCDIFRKYFTIDQVKEAFNKLVA